MVDIITLKDIKEHFKALFGWNESISIGKIDNNAERAVCFYDSKRYAEKINTVGGKKNRSYEVKPITILLRWSKNADTAECKAKEIYNFYDEKTLNINGKRVFINSIYNNPIVLGTDENGVYEYSFEFDFYFAKE